MEIGVKSVIAKRNGGGVERILELNFYPDHPVYTPHHKLVKTLYPNQGLHAAAMAILCSHKHAADYLRQAPVLALAVMGGANMKTRRDRLQVAQRAGYVFHPGGRLRTVMERAGVAYQLRALKPFAIVPRNWKVLEGLSKIPASALAQAIPESSYDQFAWLSILHMWQFNMARRMQPRWTLFNWAAITFGQQPRKFMGVRALDGIFDMALRLNAEGRFNTNWTAKRVNERLIEWHKELAGKINTADFLAKHGVGFEDQIDYAPLPTNATVGDFELRALRTGKDLYLEGATMHHCVVSYMDMVIAGKARIYSVTKNGENIATIELVPIPPAAPRFRKEQGDWTIRQIRGPCNEHVPIRIVEQLVQYIHHEMVGRRRA